jgi:hypothetical protein
VTQAAQQTGESSVNVLTFARSLSGQSSDLGQRVDRFLESVRAM